MNTCPYCNATPCLSVWRKMYLGPTGTAHCRVCGYRVGLDVRKGLLAMGVFLVLMILIPIVLWLIAAADSLSDPVIIPAVMVVLIIFSFIALLSLFAFWVPIRKDQIVTSHMVEEGRARIVAQQQSRNAK